MWNIVAKSTVMPQHLTMFNGSAAVVIETNAVYIPEKYYIKFYILGLINHDDFLKKEY